MYRVVQNNFTQEIEVFYDRAFSIFSRTSVKKDIEYFNFWCKIQLDHLVCDGIGFKC